MTTPLSIRITDHTRDFDQTIEINPSPAAFVKNTNHILEPFSISDSVDAGAPSIGDRYTKVLSSGDRMAGNDPRTDHVAVIDHETGLMWAVESLGDPANEDSGITQEHCIERCKQLRLLGFKDWHLSSRAELAGLVDDTRAEPAINPTLFPRMKPRRHWTSTPFAGDPAFAWGVSFDSGGVSGSRRGYDGFALACRRAGQ